MKIELRHIHKRFGRVHANNDISLTVPAGTIFGILGENGAGKSTLMKILSGFIQADSGEILLDDQPVVIQSPADAIRHGVGMLHQDPLDFPPMRVVDNFIIGRDNRLFPNRKAAAQELLQLADQFHLKIDPEAYIDTLTVGERQQLEILRLLALGARTLILDEPTTGISAEQKQALFDTLRKLAEMGKSVIFVSHKLEDVEQLCHRAAVLRQGKLVGQAEAPYDIDALVEMMFGRVIELGARQDKRQPEITLQLRQLTIEDVRLRIENVTLDVHRGEVIGLAGMEGSGQTRLLRACAGLLRPVHGRVLLNGEDLTGKTYPAFKSRGVAFLPAARLEEGLVNGLTLTEHFVLAEPQHSLLIDRAAARQLAEERIARFNIRGTPETPVEALSGGNQQRALLALLRTPLNLILLDNPTRGLDIESVIYIWGKLKERCEQGTAILFTSPDLDEILRYSDRILVFFNGQVSPPIEAAQASVDLLGQLIGGKGWDDLQPTPEENVLHG